MPRVGVDVCGSFVRVLRPAKQRHRARANQSMAALCAGQPATSDPRRTATVHLGSLGGGAADGSARGNEDLSISGTTSSEAAYDGAASSPDSEAPPGLDALAARCACTPARKQHRSLVYLVSYCLVSYCWTTLTALAKSGDFVDFGRCSTDIFRAYLRGCQHAHVKV